MSPNPPVMRILIADDSRDITDTFAAVFDAYGYCTCIAHDGQEAVERAEAQTPDVAFVDIGMPRLNGYEVAERLRVSCPNTLLIAVSGWGSPADKQKAADAGFHHHFVKPADLDVLIHLVEQAGRPAA